MTKNLEILINALSKILLIFVELLLFTYISIFIFLIITIQVGVRLYKDYLPEPLIDFGERVLNEEYYITTFSIYSIAAILPMILFVLWLNHKRINTLNNEEDKISKSLLCIENTCSEVEKHIGFRIKSLVRSYDGNDKYKAISITYLDEIAQKIDKDNKVIRCVSNYMFCTGKKMDRHRLEVIQEITKIIVRKNMTFRFIISVTNPDNKSQEEILLRCILSEIKTRISLIKKEAKSKKKKYIKISFCNNVYNDVLIIENYFFIHFNSTDSKTERSGFMVEDKMSAKIMRLRIDEVWENSLQMSNHPLAHLQKTIESEIRLNCKDLEGYYEFIDLKTDSFFPLRNH